MHLQESRKHMASRYTPRVEDGPILEAMETTLSPDFRLPQVEYILAAIAQHGDRVNHQNRAGWTPLRWAVSQLRAEESVLQVVLALLAAGASQTLPAHRGNLIPLHEAARRGLCRVVRAMLVASPELVNFPTDPARLNCLHYAIESGRLDLVNMLVTEFHADVNAVTADGNTAAHYVGALRTSHHGNPAKQDIFRHILEVLIDNGANPWMVNASGHTVYGKFFRFELNQLRRRDNPALTPLERRQVLFPHLDAHDLLDERTETRPEDWSDEVIQFEVLSRNDYEHD